MKWFPGSVTTAIQVSRKNEAILVVFVKSNDARGKTMSDLWDQVDADVLACPVVGIQLQNGDAASAQFAEIYPTPIVPASYIIDKNGKALEVITLLRELTYDEFRSKINRAVEIFLKDNQSTQSLAQHHAPPPANSRAQNATSSASSGRESQPAVDPNLVEKLRRARDLLEQKRKIDNERKAKEEKEKEIKRINDMKAMQEVQQSRRNKDLIEAAKQRTQDKLEVEKEKERVKAQIRADREDAEWRRQRGKNVEPSSVEAGDEVEPPKLQAVPSDRCRILVRLPEGNSVVEDFPSNDNLMTLIEVLKQKGSVAGEFQLARMYPKHTYADEELDKSFLDLALTPTATLIVIKKKTASRQLYPNGGGIVAFLSVFLFTPFQYLYGIVSSFLRGGNSRDESPVSSDAENEGNRRERNRGIPQGASVRRRGNISGLHNRTDDESDDDQNANWNGNSTQFF